MKPIGLPTTDDRTSGVLLHATSLPGPHGNGDLGPEARVFVDWLVRAGQRWWQMLPVGPLGYGDSPYSAPSAFAGNPLLIDIDGIGVAVDREELPREAVDYHAATEFRRRHLARAVGVIERDPSRRSAVQSFCEREAAWLDDYALFAACKRAHRGVAWTQWEPGVRDRDPAALDRARDSLADDVRAEKVTQFLFDEQWGALRAYCNARGIALVGDVPIFVAHDSADVWQHRELFEVDGAGNPTSVAGVPPDYFSATGQRWGNPLYRWDRMAEDGYAWWVARMQMALRRFDAVRLDHFIGFVRYWKIPATSPTAIAGAWAPGPGAPLFEKIRARTGALPLIAEDLGAVTPEVTALRDQLGLPGIVLVQFAFGNDPQAPTFLPHNYERRSVVYTGTHDNDTAVGWFSDKGGGPDATRTPDEADRERAHVLAYLGRTPEESGDIHWDMIRLAQASVASTAIVPVQDLLGLGSEARMNRPGTAVGNWRWRMTEPLDEPLAARLYATSRLYGRTR